MMLRRHSRSASWLLPDGVDDFLPDDCAQLEALRCCLLNTLYLWGYQQVAPPLIEYRQSLLTGTASDLALTTFSIVDHVSGRLLGLRADMTPQVARIDAHRIPGDDIRRLCYVGHVFHALPSQLWSSRTPIQIGAELYGHAGIEADTEVIQLMITLTSKAGFHDLCLAFGHMDIFTALADTLFATYNGSIRETFLTSVDAKDTETLKQLLYEAAVDEQVINALIALLHSGGDVDVALEETRCLLEVIEHAYQLDYRWHNALETIRQLTSFFHGFVSDIHFDPASVHGYRYHNGVVFTLYDRQRAHELCRGGRYDGIGAIFGRVRPATGFSANINEWLTQDNNAKLDQQLSTVHAPFLPDDVVLMDAVSKARAQGRVVVFDFVPTTCTPCFRRQDGVWRIDEGRGV